MTNLEYLEAILHDETKPPQSWGDRDIDTALKFLKELSEDEWHTLSDMWRSKPKFYQERLYDLLDEGGLMDRIPEVEALYENLEYVDSILGDTAINVQGWYDYYIDKVGQILLKLPDSEWQKLNVSWKSKSNTYQDRLYAVLAKMNLMHKFPDHAIIGIKRWKEFIELP